MAKAVLDASAILAWINEEPGSDKVDRVLNDAVVSTVNLSEVSAILVDRGVPEDRVEDAVDLGVQSISFDHEQAIAASRLRAITQPYGLSLGDRCCLAVGWVLKLPILTADLQWKKVKVEGVRLRFIR